jgi:uncharacterized protein YfiM (DUF2279 family)
MSDAIGIVSIAAGAALGLVVGLVGWTRLARAAAFGLMVVVGLVIGAGALIVQDDVSGAEWLVGLVVLAALSPVHARFLFGRPGVRA